MKTLAGLCVGIVAGFLLGGIGPRGEAAALARQLDSGAECREASGPAIPGLSEIFAPPPSAPDAPPEPAESATAAEPMVAPDAGPFEPAPEPPAAPEPAFDPTVADLEQFDVLADAQRVRAAQSRAALEEQADLDDEQMAEVDRIVAEMNEELAPFGEELVAMYLSNRQPSARQLLGFTHQVTGILHEAQVAMEAVVGLQNAPDVDDEALSIWNQIDLETFRPAMEEARDAAQP